MAGNTEPLDYGLTGQTIYTLIRDRASGNYWNGTGLEAYSSANYATYDVPMPETPAGSRTYILTAPATLPAGDYDFLCRLQAGGAPAESDAPVGEVTDNWDGAALQPVGGAANLLDLTLAGHTTPGTVGAVYRDWQAFMFGKKTVSGTTLLVYDLDGTTLLHSLPLSPSGGPFTSVGPAA